MAQVRIEIDHARGHTEIQIDRPELVDAVIDAAVYLVNPHRTAIQSRARAVTETVDRVTAHVRSPGGWVSLKLARRLLDAYRQAALNHHDVAHGGYSTPRLFDDCRADECVFAAELIAECEAAEVTDRG